jgi:PP-loop superfamily ATP-utilizing enzyme
MIYTRLPEIYKNETLDNFFSLRRGGIGNALEINIDPRVAFSRNKKNEMLIAMKRCISREARSRKILLISVVQAFNDKETVDIIGFAYRKGYHWVQLLTDSRLTLDPAGMKKLESILDRVPISRKGFHSFHQKNERILGLTLEVKGLCRKSQVERLRGPIKEICEYGYPVSVHLFLEKKNLGLIQDAVPQFKTWGVRMIILSPDESFSKVASFSDMVNCLSSIDAERIATKDLSFVFADIPLCLLPKKLFPFSQEVQGLYDWHQGYKIIYFPRQIAEDFYSLENKRKRRFSMCSSCGFSAICRGMLKPYLRGKESRRDICKLIRESRQVHDASSKINRFDDSIDLTLDIRKKIIPAILSSIRADAIVFFSGGSDSTLAAYLYAKKHPNRKLVLATFNNIPPYSGEKSWFNAALLMKRCRNIIKHVIVRVPLELCQNFIFKDLEEIYQDTGFYLTCYFCKMLMLTHAIFLLKRLFGGDVLVDGIRDKDFHLPFSTKSINRELAHKYDFDLARPVFEMTREEVLSSIKRNRLCAPRFFNYSPSLQAGCHTNFIKSKFKVSRMNKKKIAFYASEKMKQIDDLLR